MVNPAFLAEMGSSIGGKLINWGMDQLLNDSPKEQFRSHQNLLDEANPREIARQKQFLAGVAPAQKQYMDTLYPGTSPWEQLGSSAAGAQVQAAQPKGKGEALLSAALQAETSRKNAQTAAAASIQAAKINQKTQENVAMIHTDGGQLPTSTRMKTDVDARVSQSALELNNLKATRENQGIALDLIAQLFAMAPEEMIDLVGYKTRHRTGYREFQQMLAGLPSLYSSTELDRKAYVRDWLSKMDDRELSETIGMMRGAASMLSRGARDGAGVAARGMSILKGMRRR